MIRAHVTAVLAKVTGVTVYDTVAAPLPTLPYVVIRTDAGKRGRTGLPAVSDSLTMTITATSVGADRTQAQWVTEKVIASLLDARLTVTGRSCSPIEHLDTQPTIRDDDLNPPVYYAVDLFRFTSIPA